MRQTFWRRLWCCLTHSKRWEYYRNGVKSGTLVHCPRCGSSWGGARWP